MKSFQEKGFNISLVIRDRCKVVEGDDIVGPKSDTLLVAQPGLVLVLLVPEEVAVVVPHLGVVWSAGQAGPEELRP